MENSDSATVPEIETNLRVDDVLVGVNTWSLVLYSPIHDSDVTDADGSESCNNVARTTELVRIQETGGLEEFTTAGIGITEGSDNQPDNKPNPRFNNLFVGINFGSLVVGNNISRASLKHSSPVCQYGERSKNVVFGPGSIISDQAFGFLNYCSPPAAGEGDANRGFSSNLGFGTNQDFNATRNPPSGINAPQHRSGA